ncbi:MAG: presqualene diphosphate synthase HpnD [Burkholderiaceae bacterium]|nr:presqualene diphosphate synthase HpnD [Burkholderiaceae bacterium]
MTPDEYCAERAARSGSSFYYSFLFLPPERRRAIIALYAFCREVDDTVDEATDPQVARARLDWWRAEIGRLFAGDPQHPVTRALEPHLQACSIGRAPLVAIIDGMQMDLEQDRYLDFEGLRLYCHRVAGVVGVLAAGIFGARSATTLDYAERLGLAFQLTNIIRDVGEDARRGRIYLPIEDLQRFGVPAHEILAARPSERFVELMRFEAARAREKYRQAFALLEPAERRAQRPGLMMAAIYARLLDEIERDGFRVLTHRTSLTPLRKFWLAWKTWATGRPPRV